MFQKLKFFYLSAVSLLIGMKVTFKNLFVPSVTLQYPLNKQPMKPNFRGMVDLIPKDCVICYQCIRICPTAALDLGHKNVVLQEKKPDGTLGEKKAKEITKFTFNAELCCYCGLCEEICPTDAIYLNKMYEVSVFNHSDILHIDLMDAKKYVHINKNYVNNLTSKAEEKGTVLNMNEQPAPSPNTIWNPSKEAPKPAVPPEATIPTTEAPTTNTSTATLTPPNPAPTTNNNQNPTTPNPNNP